MSKVTTWREYFAPQIADIIAQAKTEGWPTRLLRNALKSRRPGYPPTSQQYKMWGSEQVRQLKRHLAGLPPAPFNPYAKKPVVQPKEQGSLF